ncbi:MAG: universal stress protein [Chloroflexota bacterium]|jgi:nucleotide-binding universal stress UspA family protein
MSKKILVPLDGSKFSEAVLPHVQTLAKKEGAEIILLTIPVIPSVDFIARNPGLTRNAVEETEVTTGKYLQAKITNLKKKGSKVKGILREGPIPETILEVADEVHADMIAMCTHSRTGINRWLMGSVADEVVHNAHVPVILVHPN